MSKPVYKIVMSDRPVNRKKSTNPLVKLSYRELQSLASSMQLPSKLKYKMLLALVIAKTTNRGDVVDAITQHHDLSVANKKNHKENNKNKSTQGSKSPELDLPYVPNYDNSESSQVISDYDPVSSSFASSSTNDSNFSQDDRSSFELFPPTPEDDGANFQTQSFAELVNLALDF